jgi:cyclopropane fatty-acyl-phospholipid synthase-like methyltransferase
VKVPERIAWAVEALAVDPNDRILEIGCGPGVAVDRIAERLRDGVITGIDRSETAIARAERRNAPHLASGRAVLVRTTLADAVLERGGFDKAFAVNVNLFWLRVTTELHRVRRALAPGGSLHLFYEPPGAARADEIARRAPALLEAHGFSVGEVSTRPLGATRGVCIIAAPAAG